MSRALTALRGARPSSGDAAVLPPPLARADGRGAAARAFARVARDRPVTALVAACTAIAALTLLVPSAPTYDPWAWIIWGREVLGLELDTREGPSWKPLPVLFTAPFSLFGEAAPELWLVVARTGALLALALAFRLARRLAGGGPAGIAAGLLAAGGLALTMDFVRNAHMGNSEGLLVALVLLAVERHLDGRRDHALWLVFGAALLRPEVWPFLGLYGLVLFARAPELRRRLVFLAFLLPLLWLGPELWGSGDALRASARAQLPVGPSPAFADNPAEVVLARVRDQMLQPFVGGSQLAIVLAAGALLSRRRSFGWLRARATLLLAAAAWAWIYLVALMTELGYSGNPRYLVLPIAVLCVLGGVGFAGVGRAAAEGAGRVARMLTARRAATVAATAAVAVGAALVTAAVLRAPAEKAATAVASDLPKLEAEALMFADLPAAVALAGGPGSVVACGPPATGPFEVPQLAWELGIPQHDVTLDALAPGVVFRARPARPGTPHLEKAPQTGEAFSSLGRVGEWEVLSSCGNAPGLPPRGHAGGSPEGTTP